MIELAPGFFVSPQISPEDVAQAKARGVTLILNNRPDGEEPGQPRGDTIAAAAKSAGVDYVAIPIGGMGFGPKELDAFDQAVARNAGGVLAFCRSGTRSAVLRAFAKARGGADVNALIREAAAAGYNLDGLAGQLQAARGE